MYNDEINIHNQAEVGRWVQSLIDQGRIHDFYVSKYWRRLRKEVLDEYKHECQVCKSKGWYKKATHVHHVQFITRHPHLALSKTYIWQGEEKQNLIPVCEWCHENACHPERLRKKKKESTISERWD